MHEEAQAPRDTACESHRMKLVILLFHLKSHTLLLHHLL
jgi:hypothetical protein